MKALPKASLDPETRAFLQSILDKPMVSLTADEILFLRARRMYLSESELKAYDNVLTVKSPKEDKKPETSNK